MSRYADNEPECVEKPAPVQLEIDSRPRDIGGLEVDRLLPSRRRRMVGPYIFLDHIGPSTFEPGRGIDVKPHPHIGLATVTYLLDGAFMHRDSLGSEQLIEPGAVNWMTAGRGIVHSERTPPEARQSASRLHGLQSWVALPRDAEQMEPAFEHFPKKALPLIEQRGVRMRLIAGSAFGETAPVTTLSPLFHLDVAMTAGASLTLPDEYEERGLFPIDGSVRIGETTCPAKALAVLEPNRTIEITAQGNVRLILFGGAPLDGPRFIWWNMVSSSRDRIESARQDWVASRFPKVPGDEEEFVPAPEPVFSPAAAGRHRQ